MLGQHPEGDVKMGIKIYTYSNPYELTQEMYWDEIKDCPHFCVSQTMVNGFTDLYKHWKKNGCLTTMRILLNSLYADWEDKNTRVRQIMEVDHAIHSLALDEDNIRRSLEYNTKDLANCIRMFRELGLEADSFDESKINAVQRYLVRIYKAISRQNRSSFTFHRIQNEQDLNAGIIEALRKKHKDYPYSGIKMDSVVIHGIHQFSPAMLCAIEDIAKYKTVILLFNYQEQYKIIYKTWEKIYSLFGVPITFSRNREFKPVSLFVDSYPSNVLADNMGKLSNGDYSFQKGILHQLNVIEFENLTEFSGYCARLFEKAKTVRDRSGKPYPILNYMEEQMYSASGRVNDILRAYFPEQFGERHFLDYPIGHFFVSVMEMWDNENQCVKVDNFSLIKECLSSGIISEQRSGQLLNTFNTVESYIEKETSLDGIIKRLRRLRKYVDSSDKWLRRIGYLNCSKQELDELRLSLEDLQTIIKSFFEDFSSGGDNFNRFYRKIHDFIVKKTKNMESLDQEIKEVLIKLLARMNNIDLPETGTFTCLKQTLSYYLSQDDYLVRGANWIVRGFEQIDGDILRSSHQDPAKTCYHFCCLSDKDICAVNDERLPWPLDVSFFEYSYEPLSSNYQIFLKSKREFRNFKRYAFLYGLEFNRVGCKLSYVKSENQRDNELYHLIKMLGIKVEKYHNDNQNTYVQHLRFSKQEVAGVPDFTDIDQLKYAVCPHRFVLESLVQEKTIFRERFLIILYLRVLLQNKIETSYAGKNLNEIELQKIIQAEYRNLDDKFHISNEYEKTQIISSVYAHLSSKGSVSQYRRDKNKQRNRVKEDFLFTDLRDFDSNDYLSINLNLIVESGKRYPDNPGSACKYCSSKDICLKGLSS